MVRRVIEAIVGDFTDFYFEMYIGISIRKTVKKETFLLKQGEKCPSLWFIEKGAVKGFENIDGKDITTFFFTENTFITNYHCWITGGKSGISFQAVEDCVIIDTPIPKLKTLCLEHPIFDTISIKLTERLFVKEFHLRKILLNSTATERYEYIEKSNPEILNRFPLKDIASFIGITAVSLSRIRKTRLSKKK